MEKKNILFTGPPGCGKSTLIERIVQDMTGPCAGFFTREIREQGRRVGFSINTLDGEQGVLAHRNIKSRIRVGKYGVNMDDIDRIAVPAMLPEREDVLVVIDEIGKMECFSALFRKALIKVLGSKNPVIGSISMKGTRFIESVKAREDVLIVGLSERNRETLAQRF